MTKPRLSVAPSAAVNRTVPPRLARLRPVKAVPAPKPIIEDAFFRHIVSGMRNGVLVVTRDSRLALMNEEAYRILGIGRAATDAGRPVADVLRSQPEIVRVLATAFDLHLLPNRVELRLSNSGKVIGYTTTLVRDDQGAVVGVAMFFKDLTRVEQLEERERLRDRLAALGEMAAAIAHEVKNPLAGIEVMSGLLRRKLPDEPEAQKVLADIINEAKMANAIVQEVLEFVRPIRLQIERTGLGDAVRAALQLAEMKERSGDVEVSVDLSPDLPKVHGDLHQLTQLFTNLLTNAYEAMEGRGRVAVTASTIRLDDGMEGRDAVVVGFTDDGPGMPPDVSEHIFDPFFTTKPQGSGLGLAIVRKIVDAHDGQIDLHTTPGGGTTIHVTLPVGAVEGSE